MEPRRLFLSSIFAFLGMMATAGLMVLPSFEAEAGAGGAAFAAIICKIVTMTQGPIGRPVATAAIIAIACMAMFGRISWGMVMITIVGIVIIFSAGQIVASITGMSSTCGSAGGSGGGGGGTTGGTGGGAGGGGNSGSGGCTSDNECAINHICVSRACYLVCITDSGCAPKAGTTCQNVTGRSQKICLPPAN
jgi:type IV secretory pathway VirB2 component (pilin)